MEKVLIIDHSKFSQQMLSMFLNDDYEILSATNGTVGLQLAKIHIPALILLDIEMPDMASLEMLEILKSNAATRDIPVIIMTGASQPKSEEKALFLGAVDFIAKPFREMVVRARVRTHVDMFTYRQTIESQLLVDMSTKIPNRIRANLIIYEKWNEAQNSDQPLSIAKMDIDCFGHVNQTYGFQQAERILLKVAATAQNIVVKHGGFIARYEGDKFVMEFSDTDKDIAQGIANEVRLAVQECALANSDSSVADVITVSIGGDTIYPKNEKGIGECVITVEKMLRAAKAKGRNCVVWNDESSTL